MKTVNILLSNLLLFCFAFWSVQGNTMVQALTKEHKLENGLKIIVREDFRAPVVVSQIWYKVGSSDETRWITGISHALEHMMFQGTPTLPKDGFSELISRYGGQNNAFTTEDYTVYYEELDAENLRVSFEAEADRMSHLLLPPEAYAKEIQVVIEERRLRVEDNPQNFAFERFMAVAQPMGPYHHPVIGWQVDLDRMKVEDLRRWYENWYSPNNAILIVVGAVKAEEVFSMAAQYFGSIPSRATQWDVRSQEEILPVGEQRIKIHQPAELPYGIWGFAVPSLKSAENQTEAFALLVASAILDGGNSAWFAKELIRKEQVATGVFAYYEPLKKYANQFIVAGTPSKGHTIADLEKSVMKQFERLKTTLVSDAELARVKTQILAQEVFNRDSMSDQAIRIGMFEGIGLSWQLLDEYVEKVNSVTAHDVQAVAQKYFQPKRLTAAELVPEKINQSA